MTTGPRNRPGGRHGTPQERDAARRLLAPIAQNSSQGAAEAYSRPDGSKPVESPPRAPARAVAGG